MAKRYDVFTVREYEQDGEKKGYWSKIGSAFENKDKSLSILLDALPVNGKMQVREPYDEERDGKSKRSDKKGGDR